MDKTNDQKGGPWKLGNPNHDGSSSYMAINHTVVEAPTLENKCYGLALQ